MENIEINFKRLLRRALLLSLFLSALIWGFSIFNILSTPNCSSSNLTSKEAQVQNGQFESYFGTHVSSTEVKQLLSLVRSNNVSGRVNGEDKIIYINDYNCTVFSIVKGNYYTVEVKNDKTVTPNDESMQEPGASVKVPNNQDAGYYDNGYIRNIRITNNNGDIVITPNTDSSSSNSTINNSIVNSLDNSSNTVNSNK
ncbi:MAG: hypothetical protein IKG56_04840 [Clostridia bacterium]|nr:hypothetical protein [Clostridia bacterium]